MSVGSWEASFTTGGNLKWCAPFGGQLAISVKDSNGQIHGLSSFSS